MTHKKSSLKSGLVFSAAVAGSIIGSYHRAYSLSCDNGVTNDPNFGTLFTCDDSENSQPKQAEIVRTGDFSKNMADNSEARSAGFRVVRNVENSFYNVSSLNITLSTGSITTQNAAGFSFSAAQNDQANRYGENDVSISIGSDFTINTTSNGIAEGYGFNFKEAVSINNSAGDSNTAVTINGDVTIRGVVDGGLTKFDDAVRIYKYFYGNTNITIGQESAIKAYDGGDALYSYGGHGRYHNVTANISGDIMSEEGSAIVILKGDSSIQTVPGASGNMSVTINSTSTIEAKKDAVFLFTNGVDDDYATDSGTITFTTSGDITSSQGNAVSIDGSSRSNAARDQIIIQAGASLNGKTAALVVKDNFSDISLTGGVDFESENPDDFVTLTGDDGVAIRLGRSTLQTSIHDNDIDDHVTDFTDVADHPTIAGTEGAANHTLNISGNVVVTGDIIGGENSVDVVEVDNDIINLNAANLTLISSDVSEFESINVTENSVLSVTENSSIAGKITANTNKTLSLNLTKSSLIGDGANAVEFGTGNDSITIRDVSAITGRVNGGAGVDSFALDGATLTIQPGGVFENFENLNVSGANQISEGISFDNQNFTVTVNQDASLSAAASTINNNASLISAVSGLDGDGQIMSANIQGTLSSIADGVSTAKAISFEASGNNDVIDFTVASSGSITSDGNAISLTKLEAGGSLTANINGDVTSQSGIAIAISANDVISAVNLNGEAAISGSTAISFSNNSQANLTIAGSGTGVSLVGAVKAISFDTKDDTMTVGGVVAITGDVDGGAGADTLNFNAAALTLNSAAKFENFETLNFAGSNTITGAFSTSAAEVNLNSGSSLTVAGGVNGVAGSAMTMTIDGATLSSGGSAATSATFANQNDSLTVKGTSAITGMVNGGAGVDTLTLNAATLTIQVNSIFARDFENLNVSGANQVTEMMSFQGGAFAFTVNQGASLSADAATINDNDYLITALSDVDNATISATINGSLSSSQNGIAFEEGNAQGNIISFTTSAGSSIQTDGESVNLSKSILSADGSLTANIAGEISSANGNALNISAPNVTSVVNVTGQASISGDIAINFATNSQANLTVGGTGAGVEIVGNSSKAISFSDENDTMTVNGIAAISGDVDGGDGADTLNLSGATLTFTDDSELVNFEQINIDGDNVFNGRLNAANIVLSNENESSLEFNGILTLGVAPLTVSDGFYLAGNMTLEGNLEANGGFISPGAVDSGIGEMTINGNVIFESGSTLIIDINGNNSDSFVVNGTIDIMDGANLVINPIGATSGSATIMSANVRDGNGGIINGVFKNVSSTAGGNITLLYSNNNLDLNYVTLNTNVLSAQIQSSVDNSILFSDTLNKQISRGAFAKGRDFWMRNIYRNRDIDNSGSQVGFSDKSYGVAFGAENDFDDSIRYGFSAGYIDSNINISNSQGGKDGSSYFAAAYANYKTTNNLFASLAMTVGYHDNDNSRAVTNSGVKSYAKSSSSDKEIGLNLQAGKKFTLKNIWSITPKFSASYIRTMAGSVKEDASTAGNSAISLKSYEFSTLKLRESVRLERLDLFKFSQVEFSPYLELGLSQERAIGDRNISGSFAAANQEFTVKLKNNNRSFVTAATGFNMKINKDVSAFVSYENAVSKDETRNDFNAGVNIKF